jgi:hypothetical protein
MRRLRITIAVVAMLAILGAAVLWFMVFRQFGEYPAVPFQDLWLEFQDEDGVANIRCESFRIAFEGHSLGTRRHGGSYPVDGRYAPRLFPGAGAGPVEIQIADGLHYEYSPRQRLVTIWFHEHQITYSHALKRLTVNDREFSTTTPVSILVKRSGEAEQVAN